MDAESKKNLPSKKESGAKKKKSANDVHSQVCNTRSYEKFSKLFLHSKVILDLMSHNPF